MSEGEKMKIICQQQDLSKALNTVQKAITNRTTIPILKGIYLEALPDGVLKLAASDLDLSIEKKINVNTLQTGSFVVSSKLFTEIIRKLPEGEIEIELIDNTVMVKSFNSEFTIIKQSAEDFPEINTSENNNNLTLNKEIFKNMIKQTAFSASIDESRGIIVGVLIEFGKESINMVALDGFRMAIRKEKIINTIEKKIIIPARILNEIYKILLDHEDNDLLISINDKNIVFKIDNTIISSRLLEGEYINYKEIIPKNYTSKVKLNKEELYSSIERASLLAREGKNNLIKIKTEESKMIITSRSEEGTVHEEVYIEKEGDVLEIGFNSKYILDILRNVDDEELYFEFISNVSPCLIRPLDGLKFEYLLLPVRISIS